MRRFFEKYVPRIGLVGLGYAYAFCMVSDWYQRLDPAYCDYGLTCVH